MVFRSHLPFCTRSAAGDGFKTGGAGAGAATSGFKKAAAAIRIIITAKTKYKG